MQRFAGSADSFTVHKRYVKQILVDEILVKIKGKGYWVWIAYESSLHACLSMHLSGERTILVFYQFLKELRVRYCRKTICKDGGSWYEHVCRWLRLDHVVYGINLKNLIERFMQYIKEGTECFDDHFPCRIGTKVNGGCMFD